MSKPLHSAEYKLLLLELRRARQSAGISQAALGSRIGEDQSFVSKCEAGVRRLDVIELRRWMRALGGSLPEFIDRLEDRIERNRSASPLRKAEKRRDPK